MQGETSVAGLRLNRYACIHAVATEKETFITLRIARCCLACQFDAARDALLRAFCR